MYDYVVIGSGFFGAVFAHEMKKANKKVIVIEKRNHIGGNSYTKNISGINVHKYGPHLFNTNKLHIWKYIQNFAEFNDYHHRIKVIYNRRLYHFPINLNTFNQLWKCITPEEAKRIVENKKVDIKNPSNLEEWILSQVGEEIYNIFIKDFTHKQWGRPCSQLPASIIRRVPIRFNFNDHYHDSKYCGIPIGGYTQIFEKLLDGIELKLDTDFETDWRKYAKRLVFTGPIDEFFQFKFEPLEYRSLRFIEETMKGISDYQGIGQINYTDKDVPFTRSVEHKHFEFGKQEDTVITRELPQEWKPGLERFYPINDEKNEKKYKEYQDEADKIKDVVGGGRLWSYKYLDMDDVIDAALKLVKKELSGSVGIAKASFSVK